MNNNILWIIAAGIVAVIILGGQAQYKEIRKLTQELENVQDSLIVISIEYRRKAANYQTKALVLESYNDSLWIILERKQQTFKVIKYEKKMVRDSIVSNSTYLEQERFFTRRYNSSR